MNLTFYFCSSHLFGVDEHFCFFGGRVVSSSNVHPLVGGDNRISYHSKIVVAA